MVCCDRGGRSPMTRSLRSIRPSSATPHIGGCRRTTHARGLRPTGLARSAAHYRWRSVRASPHLIDRCSRLPATAAGCSRGRDASAVDLGANVTMILWDNRGYQQIRQSFDDVDAPRMGVDVSSHDPLTIAKGFGCRQLTSPLRTNFSPIWPWPCEAVDNFYEFASKSSSDYLVLRYERESRQRR